MKRPTRRGLALGAGALALAPAASATVMSPDPVIFQGLFETPLARASAISSATGSRLSAKLQITNNSREPLRVSTIGSLTPELVDARGAAVPFAGGANMARRPNALTLEPGKSVSIPLEGVLRLSGQALSWKGDDGLVGKWRIDPAAPYSLRLRYRALEPTAWPGLGLSHNAPLLPAR